MLPDNGIQHFASPDPDQKFVYLVARPAEPGQRFATKVHSEGQNLWQKIEDKFVAPIPHDSFRTAARKLLAKIRGCFDCVVGEFAMLGLEFGLAHIGIMVDDKYYHLKKETEGERKGHIALDIKPFPENSIISGYPIWKTKRTHEERGRLALCVLAAMRMKWDLRSTTETSFSKIMTSFATTPLHRKEGGNLTAFHITVMISPVSLSPL